MIFYNNYIQLFINIKELTEYDKMTKTFLEDSGYSEEQI